MTWRVNPEMRVWYPPGAGLSSHRGDTMFNPPIGRITRPFAQHCSSLAHIVSEILPAPTAHMLGQAVVGASPNLGRTNII